MKQYSFVQEFGNCAAGLTGFESIATKSKKLPSLNSLLKPKTKNRGNQTMRSKVYKKEKSLA